MKQPDPYKGYIRFSQQFSECRTAGNNLETQFVSFKEDPKLLPLFPDKDLVLDIQEGRLTGVERIKCKVFGGFCDGGNPDCREIRGMACVARPIPEHIVVLDLPESTIPISAPVAE